MKREVWFKGDLAQQLVAARQPLLQAGVDGDFRKGYEAALVTLALAFGLPVEAIGLIRATATVADRDGAPLRWG